MEKAQRYPFTDVYLGYQSSKDSTDRKSNTRSLVALKKRKINEEQKSHQSNYSSICASPRSRITTQNLGLKISSTDDKPEKTPLRRPSLVYSQLTNLILGLSKIPATAKSDRVVNPFPPESTDVQSTDTTVASNEPEAPPRQDKIDIYHEDLTSLSIAQLPKSQVNGGSLPLPPWTSTRHIPNPTAITLHEEILEFYQYIRPSNEERILRLDLFGRMKDLIISAYPRAKVRLFGSTVTDMLLPSSDIDMVVLNIGGSLDILYTVAQLMMNAAICNKPQVISNARVPIVKIVDSFTGYQADISFEQYNGLSNTALINRFTSTYEDLRPLIVLLKYYLYTRGLNEPFSGGIGSYALSLMTISFLQLHQKTILSETKNFGTLLIHFLELYGRYFNYYTTGISIQSKGHYFNKISKNWIDPNQPFLPAIEDPNDPTNDVGRSSFRIFSIRKAFRDAYDYLTVSPAQEYAPTILSKIIKVDPAVEAARQILRKKCQYLLQSSSSFRKNVSSLLRLRKNQPCPLDHAAEKKERNSSEAASTNNFAIESLENGTPPLPAFI